MLENYKKVSYEVSYNRFLNESKVVKIRMVVKGDKRFWKVMKGSKMFRKVVKDFERFWKVSKGFERFWKVSKSF